MSAEPTDTELVELIEASSSLDELLTGLAERGSKLRGRKLRRRLSRAWKKRPVATSPADDTSEALPASVVRRGDVEYHIHGIVHGQRRVVRVGAEVRDTVRASITAWDDPPMTGVCLERGMAGVFGVPESFDLRYTDVYVRKAGAGLILRSTLRLVLMMPLLPFVPLLMRVSPDPMTRELRHAMRSLRRFVDFRARYLATELPGRIGVGLDRMSASGRSRVLHSECQAEAAVARAEQLGVHVMHMVVGVGHEADLEHLLPRVA